MTDQSVRYLNMVQDWGLVKKTRVKRIPKRFAHQILDPGGIKQGGHLLDPGGVTDISRGLRSASDDTPGSRSERISHPGGPGGMPDDPDSNSEKNSAKFPTTPPERPRLNRHPTSLATASSVIPPG
jgi:hypothetical protein